MSAVVINLTQSPMARNVAVISCGGVDLWSAYFVHGTHTSHTQQLENKRRMLYFCAPDMLFLVPKKITF